MFLLLWRLLLSLETSHVIILLVKWITLLISSNLIPHHSSPHSTAHGLLTKLILLAKVILRLELILLLKLVIELILLAPKRISCSTSHRITHHASTHLTSHRLLLGAKLPILILLLHTIAILLGGISHLLTTSVHILLLVPLHTSQEV